MKKQQCVHNYFLNLNCIVDLTNNNNYVKLKFKIQEHAIVKEIVSRVTYVNKIINCKFKLKNIFFVQIMVL